LTGTVTEVPEVLDRGHEVVVVEVAMVVVVGWTTVVAGAVEGLLLHAPARIPVVVMTAVQRIRRCLTTQA
jgi:hypothetical protein